MAKIIYKKWEKGQNKLSSIKGIEIDLFNGQKALIYPKYSEGPLLSDGEIGKWDARTLAEIEALKVTDTVFATECLRDIDSPSALWVSQFKYAKYSNFSLPSLLAAMEIQHQKKEIDALAETIDGADLLRDFVPKIWSCLRCGSNCGWYAGGYGGYANYGILHNAYLAVPTILYK